MAEPVKFYLGTRLDRLSLVKGIRTQLEQLGWQSTFDWYDMTGKTRQEIREGGEKEVTAVMSADVVCISLPPSSNLPMHGTHTEFGIAIALQRISGRQLLVLHAERESDILNPQGTGKCQPFYLIKGVNILVCPIDAIAINLNTLYEQFRRRLGAQTPRGTAK